MAKPGDPEEEIDEIEDGQEGEDAGLIDNEGGDETETGQEPETDQAEERVESRGERRQQKLSNELRAAREQAELTRRELEQLRAERAQINQQPQEESEDQFRARLAVMTQDERIEARLERSDRIHRREMALLAMQSADASDRSAYQAKGAYDPRYKKYEKEVEQLYWQEVRAGRNFPRETILKFFLGQKVLEAEGKGKPSVRRDVAQSNVQRNQARTTGGGSDRLAQRQTRRYAADDMSPEAVRARLDGVYI